MNKPLDGAHDLPLVAHELPLVDTHALPSAGW